MQKDVYNEIQQITTTAKTTNYPTVDSVIKALEILDCFNRQETDLSLKQLCSKTGLYKSRVHRLCATLLESGYLVRSSWTNYRLGPKLLSLGKTYEQANSLKSVASTYMRQLSRQTGESTALFILNQANCICVAREVSEARLVFTINEGDTMDLAPTAAGRVLLAYAQADLQHQVLSSSIQKKFTEHTKIAPIDIEKELNSICENGYGFNEQELENGISAIAAPIYNYANKVIAALAIVGPSQHFKGKEKRSLLTELLKTTEQISGLV